MREILEAAERWRAAGESFAVATVVHAWGSSPRPVGSKMAISAGGDMVGSVSGGCVEGAVFEEARSVLASGEPKLLSYGVSDETAWSVGLSCGGRIEVFVERPGALFDAVRRAVDERQLVALATVLEGPGRGNQLLIWPGEQTLGNLGTPRLNQRAALFTEKVFGDLASKRKALRSDEGRVDVFFELHLPPPLLVIVGAVHVAIHLIELARRLGFRTVVVDPRTAFATPERFAAADELITEWPQDAFPRLAFDEATYLAVLSHDLKLDVPALAYALATPARYVGALGSSRTHAKRVAALEEAGVARERIGRIRSPIGLDLGGRRAEEIALAVMAEIVAASHGKLAPQRG